MMKMTKAQLKAVENLMNENVKIYLEQLVSQGEMTDMYDGITQGIQLTLVALGLCTERDAFELYKSAEEKIADEMEG